MIDYSKKPTLRKSGRTYIDRKTGQEITPRAFIHPCMAEGCEEDGSFGFLVSLIGAKPKPGIWFCTKHRHLGEMLKK